MEFYRGFLKIVYTGCLLYIVSTHIAGAATTRTIGIEKLLTTADVVVYGHFNQVISEWRGKKIYTRGFFSVEESIKGEQLNAFEIEYLGGTAIHPLLKSLVTMKSSEGISFRQDEDIVLLLKLDSNQQLKVIGLSRGIIKVYTDPINGEKYLSGLKKIHGQALTKGNQVTIDSKPMTLSEFGDYVRNLNQPESTDK